MFGTVNKFKDKKKDKAAAADEEARRKDAEQRSKAEAEKALAAQEEEQRRRDEKAAEDAARRAREADERRVREEAEKQRREQMRGLRTTLAAQRTEVLERCAALERHNATALDADAAAAAAAGVDAAALDATWRVGVPSDDEMASESLETVADELHYEHPVTELVLVGLRGEGKSALLESLLGMRAAFCRSSTGGTTRPVHYYLRAARAGTATSVRITDDHDKRAGDDDTAAKAVTVAPAKLAEAIEAALYSRSRQVSSVPLHVEITSAALFGGDVNIIDTPGLVHADDSVALLPGDLTDEEMEPEKQLREDEEATRSIVRAVVAARPHALLVAVERTRELERSRLHALVRPFDPAARRTVFVHTHFAEFVQDSLSPSRVTLADASGYGARPPLRTFLDTVVAWPRSAFAAHFFLAGLSAPARDLAQPGDDARLRRLLLASERRTQAVLAAHAYDTSFGGFFGIAALRAHLAAQVRARARSQVPALLARIDTARSLTRASIEAIDREIASDPLAPATMRTLAGRFAGELARTIVDVLHGSVALPPGDYGLTQAEELEASGVGDAWVPEVKISGGQLAEWNVPSLDVKLFGGAQFERLVAEARQVAAHLEYVATPDDDIEVLMELAADDREQCALVAVSLGTQRARELFSALAATFAERAKFVLSATHETAEALVLKRFDDVYANADVVPRTADFQCASPLRKLFGEVFTDFLTRCTATFTRACDAAAHASDEATLAALVASDARMRDTLAGASTQTANEIARKVFVFVQARSLASLANVAYECFVSRTVADLAVCFADALTATSDAQLVDLVAAEIAGEALVEQRAQLVARAEKYDAHAANIKAYASNARRVTA